MNKMAIVIWIDGKIHEYKYSKELLKLGIKLVKSHIATSIEVKVDL